jgi:xanthine dehydrogenase YagT iron-sulfur-binding subunit
MTDSPDASGPRPPDAAAEDVGGVVDGADGADGGGAATVQVVLHVNGAEERLTTDVRSTLLDTLRDGLGLTGTKKGCDRGQCGACTVHVDGRRVLSCLTLAAAADGKRITTIEGLGEDGRLHPVQQAFLDNDGFQCGFCTSGQIMSAVCVIEDGLAGSDASVREAMSGNICRCGAYDGILRAVRSAADADGAR